MKIEEIKLFETEWRENWSWPKSTAYLRMVVAAASRAALPAEATQGARNLPTTYTI